MTPGKRSWQECRVSVDKDNCDLKAQGDPSTVRLEVAAVRECLAVKTLSLASLVESDICAAHDNVVDETSGSDDIDEPCQDLRGVVGQLQERQEGEDHDNQETVDWYSVLGALAEESGGTALDGERVQTSGCAVGVCVTGGEDTGNQQCVDKVGQTVDVEVLHGDDVWGCRSRALAGGEDRDKLGIIVGKNNTDTESSEDEEGAETEVDRLESVLDVDTGTLRFTRHHGDVLRSNDAEGCSPKSSEETLEFSKVGIAFTVRVEDTRILPVTETVGIFLRVATNHRDEGEEVEDQDQEDLAT
jgi:hypothetical protein